MGKIKTATEIGGGMLYCYLAAVQSVYDGDTIRADTDQGMNVMIKNGPLRLSRIDAPEVRGSTRIAGLESRDYLRERIGGKTVMIQTLRDKKGKYGRFIAEVWLPVEGGWLNINDELVAKGHAVYKEY